MLDVRKGKIVWAPSYYYYNMSVIERGSIPDGSRVFVAFHFLMRPKLHRKGGMRRFRVMGALTKLKSLEVL